MASPAAHAHPFGDKHTAQRIDARIGRDTLVLHLAVDVPEPLLPALHGRDNAPDPDRLRELVVVSFNGDTLERRLIRGTLRPATDSDHTQVLEATVEVALPSSAGELRISNGTLLGHPTWHSVRVAVSPQRALLRGSHLSVRAEDVFDAGPPWRMSEAKRETRLTLGPPGLARDLYGTIDGRDPLPADAALVLPLHAALKQRRTQPGSVMVAGLLAVTLGAFHGVGIGRARAAAVLAPGLAIPFLLLAGAAPHQALAAVAASLLLGLRWRRFAAIAPWAVCLWLATMLDGRWPGLTWIGWCCALLLTARASATERPATPWIVGLAALVLGAL